MSIYDIKDARYVRGEVNMGKIIAIVNQKGGVGKTTTSINLSASLGMLGKKVLMVDLDPQGNATTGVGVDKKGINNSIYEVLTLRSLIDDAIIKTKSIGLDVIPAYLNLAGVEMELIELEKKYRETNQKINRVLRLKEELAKVKDNYDFIIIDCPPALGMLTVNAMTASDSVLVPIQCEFYALDGLSQLIYTIELIQDSLNPDLYIEGVVFTMYDARTNLSLQVVENVKDNLKQTIYKTIIPRNVRLAEAPSYGLPINLYDKRSSGTEAYRMLADEVIENAQ